MHRTFVCGQAALSVVKNPCRWLPVPARERKHAARRALADGKIPDVGGLLFETVALARAAGQEPEEALTRANAAFTRRVETCEDAALAKGVPLCQADPVELAACWGPEPTQASE